MKGGQSRAIAKKKHDRKTRKNFFLRIRKKGNFADEKVFEIDNHKNFEDEAQVEFRNKKFAKRW